MLHWSRGFGELTARFVDVRAREAEQVVGRGIIAVLVEESDRATKGAHRYKEELVLKD